MPRISSSSWTVPSSPPGPCRAMNATSGRSSFSRATRSAPGSISTTSWPSERSASSTRAPERSETCALERASAGEHRDAHQPSPSACAASGRTSAHLAAPARRLRRGTPVLARDRLVQRHLLPDHLADAADPLADLVRGEAEKLSRIELDPRAVDVGGRAGDEGDVLAQRLGEQVARVDVVGQRRPAEQPALGPAPVALRREVALERVEHRVAALAVDLGEARRRSRASGPRRSTRRRSTGSESRCRGRWPACRARSSPSPAAARTPSRAGSRGRGSSRSVPT